ncbi:iron chaperone [Compostibacter hankyongensis]|uniref:DUF1801 domain-containing protein n=1 Tax=Compostibacter hankyongensis TaxID=1007089 RepID=A0ABP8FFU6_9BACT
MENKKAPARNVDEYIADSPESVRPLLEQLRTTIKKAAPGAEEKISYAIPAFILHGHPVAYFAAFKKHIGFYPAPRQHPLFEKTLAAYKGGKGTVQFPLDSPLPLDLIRKMVKYRAEQARARKV